MPSPAANSGAPTTARSFSLRRLLGAVALLLVLSAAAAAVHFVREATARAERGDGLRLARRGQFRDAEPLLRRALDRSPADAEVVRALAIGTLSTADVAAAEAALAHWCELCPDDVESFQSRMRFRHGQARAATAASERQRLLELAAADGRRVLELAPSRDSVAGELVWLLLRTGRLDEADRLCRRCRARAPRDGWLIYLQAKICHDRGAGREAQELLDGLLRDEPGLREEPRFARALLLRAELHLEAGAADQAVPLFRQVLVLDPALRADVLYPLALALARTGEVEEAKRLSAEVQQANEARLSAR